MKINVFNNQKIKKRLQIYLLSICTFIGLYGITLPAQSSFIEKNVGPDIFATIGANQKKDIESVLKTMTPEQQQIFFKSFKYHYHKIKESRKKDTVSINLSTISYHNPDNITEDDITKIIKQARKHAMIHRNHQKCYQCSHHSQK